MFTVETVLEPLEMLTLVSMFTVIYTACFNIENVIYPQTVFVCFI